MYVISSFQGLPTHAQAWGFVANMEMCWMFTIAFPTSYIYSPFCLGRAWEGLERRKKAITYYYKPLSGLKPSDVARRVLPGFFISAEAG
jgi:hypothetical protein